MHVVRDLIYNNKVVKLNNLVAIGLIVGFVSLALGYSIVNNSIITVAMVAVLACVVLFIRAPMFFFLFVLVSKPLIDLTGRFKYLGFNIQSLWVIIIDVMFIFYFLNYIITKEKKLRSGILFPLALFILINLINIPLSYNIQGGIADFLRITSGVPFFLLGWVLLRDKKRILRFMWLFVIVLILPAMLGYLQHFGLLSTSYHTTAYIGGTIPQVLTRLTCGYYYSPRTYPLYLSFGMLFLIFLIGKTSRKSRKLLLTSLLILLFIPGVFTYMRVFLFVIFIELMVYAFLKRKIKLNLFLTIIALASVFYFRNFFITFFSKELVAPFTSGETFSLHGRREIWHLAFQHFSESSWFSKLFGNGLSPYIFNLSIYTSNDLHSDYLRLLIETGILGLALYLWILTVMIKDSNFVMRNAKDQFSKEISIIFQSVIWGVIVWSITTRASEYVIINWYLFLLASIVFYFKRGLLDSQITSRVK